MPSKIDYGQVDVELNGKTYKLIPSIDALRKIDEHFGSIRVAIQSVSSLSFHGMSFIVATAARLTDRGKGIMEEDLFLEGMVSASGPISDFLVKLMDPSGKSQDEDEEMEEAETGKESA